MADSGTGASPRRSRNASSVDQSRNGASCCVAWACPGTGHGGWGCAPAVPPADSASACFHRPGEFWPAEIRVLSPLREIREREVLLHEMVHFALYLAGVREEQHGEHFIAALE